MNYNIFNYTAKFRYMYVETQQKDKKPVIENPFRNKFTNMKCFETPSRNETIFYFRNLSEYFIYRHFNSIIKPTQENI